MVRVTSQESDCGLCRGFLWYLFYNTLLVVLEASSLVDFVFVCSGPFSLARGYLRLGVIFAMEAQAAVWMVDTPLLLFGFVAGYNLFGGEVQCHDGLYSAPEKRTRRASYRLECATSWEGKWMPAKP